MSRTSLSAALLSAALLSAPYLAGCNACSSDDAAERAKKRNADPLGKARKAPRRQIDRKEMKAAKAKMRARGESRVIRLSATQLPVDEREVAPEVAAARDLILSEEEAKVTEGRMALDTWIASNPDDADAYYWRGRSWSATYDFATALADYAAATTKAPEWVQAWRWAGLAAFQVTDCKDALPYLERPVELAPDDMHSWADRGQCRGGARDLEGAVADLNKACDLGHEDSCRRLPRFERRLERRGQRGRRFGEETAGDPEAKADDAAPEGADGAQDGADQGGEPQGGGTGGE